MCSPLCTSLIFDWAELRHLKIKPKTYPPPLLSENPHKLMFGGASWSNIHPLPFGNYWLSLSTQLTLPTPKSPQNHEINLCSKLLYTIKPINNQKQKQKTKPASKNNEMFNSISQFQTSLRNPKHHPQALNQIFNDLLVLWTFNKQNRNPKLKPWMCQNP